MIRQVRLAFSDSVSRRVVLESLPVNRDHGWRGALSAIALSLLALGDGWPLDVVVMLRANHLDDAVQGRTF
jgi:hypothetical protein